MSPQKQITKKSPLSRTFNNENPKPQLLRRSTTKIWDFVDRSNETQVCCKICKDYIPYVEKVTSTGNIWRHKCIVKKLSGEQTALNFNGKPLSRLLSQKQNELITRLLFKVIAEDDRPFAMVSSIAFRNLLYELNPSYSIPDVKTLKTKMMEYENIAIDSLKRTRYCRNINIS